MTVPAGHECEFPVLPPHSILEPGPCACGKPYLTHIAGQYAGAVGLLVISPPDLHRLVLLALPVTREDDEFVQRMTAVSEGGQ